MADKGQSPGVLPNAALSAACVLGWIRFRGGETDPIAFLCLVVGAVAAFGALSGASHRANEVYRLVRGMRKHSAFAGTAAFMTTKEAKKAGLCNGLGYVVGTRDNTLITDNQSVHGVMFAPPGTGKTTGPVITNAALSAVSGEWDIVIVADSKPETSVMLKTFADKHQIAFYPINSSGRFEAHIGDTAFYNPCQLVIQAVADGRSSVLEDSYSLNAQLIKVAGKNGDKNIWWKRGGIKRIAVPQVYLAFIDPERCNYSDIQAMLEDPLAYGKLLDEVATRRDLLRGDLAEMAQSIIALSVDDPRNDASMLDEAITALQMFRKSGSVAAVSQRTSIDFSKPCIITLSTDMTLVETQLQYTGLCILSLMRLAVRSEPPRRMKIIYDEAAFAPLENLNDLLVIARGLGASFELYYQSEADAVRVLGQDGFKSMMANCDRKVWAGFNDPAVAEAAAKGLGETSLLKESYRRDGETLSQSLSHERRALVTGDELRRLPTGLQVALIRNHKPLLVERLSYGEIAPLNRQIRHSPWHAKKLREKTRVWLKL